VTWDNFFFYPVEERPAQCTRSWDAAIYRNNPFAEWVCVVRMNNPRGHRPNLNPTPGEACTP
jgi:hypothetical protein